MGHPTNNLPKALPNEVKTTLSSGQELVVRNVLPRDISPLSEIYCRSYEINGADEHWTPGAAAKLLEKLYHANPGLSLVAEVDGKVAGATFGDIRPWESGKVILEGKELFVDPSLQRSGVANELLKERIHRAEVWSGANEVEIITFAKTEQPREFHEKSGFRPVDELLIMSGSVADVKDGLNRRSKK